MKMKALIVFLSSSISVVACAEGESFAAKMAGVFGAKAKVVFYVVDDAGKPVEGARVGAGFYMNKRKGNPHDFGFTDKHGLCALEEKTVNEVTYSVSKEGYYETNGRLWFGGGVGKPAIVKWGKWQPYGETYTVPLLPQKNPIPMIAYMFDGDFPKGGEIGFDLAVGDYVKPHGDGIQSDFYLRYAEEKCTNHWETCRTLKVSFPHGLDGAYRAYKNFHDKEMRSDYQTCYHANTNANYQKEIVFDIDTRNAKKTINNSLNENQYLVLRIRTKVNEKGELTEARYAKILGLWAFGADAMRFSVRMNPEANDTNLEEKLKIKDYRSYKRPVRKWKW